jgi:hypothetical protein
MNVLEERIKNLETSTIKLDECDLCGGKFNPSKLIKGKKEVRQKITYLTTWFDAINEDYVYQPKYCVRCYENGVQGKSFVHVVIKEQ